MRRRLLRGGGKRLLTLGMIALGVSAAPAAEAYIGPGAGLGVLGILLALIATMLMGIVGLVMWPIRMLAHRLKPSATTTDQEAEDPQEESDPHANAPAAREGHSTD